MNKINKIILSCFLFSIFLGLSAEENENESSETSETMVCVNTSEIIKRMPEFIDAQKKLKQFSDKHDLELNKILSSFQKKSQQYEEEASNKNANENKKRAEELLIIRKKVEDYQKNISDELEKKQNDLIIPIYKKLENAIKIIVDNNRFILRVDDCSPGKGVIFNKGIDITDDVSRELNVELN